MSDRYRRKQLLFFAVLLAISLFLLREAFRLDFFIRDTMGPGLYPAIVLGALALTCVATIVGLVRRREILIMSPFVEGLRNDTILRGLARGVSRHAGMDVRVVTRNGVGLFSALVAGLRGNGSLTVVSSETPDMTRPDIAAVALAKFQPVARLFFEPDALVVPVGRASDLAGFFAAAKDAGRLHVAFARVQAAAAEVTHWLSIHGGAPVDGEYEHTAQALLDRLDAGACDAVVMPLHEATEAMETGRVAVLCAFAGTPGEGFGLAPTAAECGYPLVEGDWAGIALPADAPPAECERYRDLFDKGFHTYTHGDNRHDEDATWSMTSTPAFRDFLAEVAAEGSGGQPVVPRGRVAGLAVAAVMVVAFPWVMDLLGFPVTAFAFLAGIMALLEPRLDLRAVLRIVIVSGLLTALLYYVFWDIFYVVFPDGLLWEGMME